MALPIRLGVLRGLVKEISASGRAGKPLVVGGARELAAVLRRELGRGARPGAVRADDDPKGARRARLRARRRAERGRRAALEARTARACADHRRRRGPVSRDVSIPYVLATDVIRVGAGEGFPLEAIAKRDRRAGSARRRRRSRRGCRCYAARSRSSSSPPFARKNGIVGAAVFVPGADLPRARAERAAAGAAARAGVRARDRSARAPAGDRRRPSASASGCAPSPGELLDLVPVAGWAVKGAVAYAGTRALGEAADPAARSRARQPLVSRPPLPGGASRAGP